MSTKNLLDLYNNSAIGIAIDIISKIAISIGLVGGGWAFNKIEKHESEIVQIKTIVDNEIKRHDTELIATRSEFDNFQKQLDRRFSDLDTQLRAQNEKMDRLLEFIIQEANVK